MIKKIVIWALLAVLAAYLLVIVTMYPFAKGVKEDSEKLKNQTLPRVFKVNDTIR